MKQLELFEKDILCGPGLYCPLQDSTLSHLLMSLSQGGRQSRIVWEDRGTAERQGLSSETTEVKGELL